MSFFRRFGNRCSNDIRNVWESDENEDREIGCGFTSSSVVVGDDKSMRLPAGKGWTRLVDEPNDIYATNRSRIHGWLGRMHDRVRNGATRTIQLRQPGPPTFFHPLRTYLSISFRFRRPSAAPLESPTN